MGPSSSSVLHLRCGSDIRDSLRAAKIEGAFLEWSDPVCQGPVRALSEAEYRAERLAWICGAWEVSRAEAETKLLPLSSLPSRLEPYEQVCLWFEHDLYDQSILVQVLAGLAERPQLHPRLRLVSIDRHPELRRFIGLGQLRPEQLPPLYAARQPIAPEAFEASAKACGAIGWRAA